MYAPMQMGVSEGSMEGASRPLFAEAMGNFFAFPSASLPLPMKWLRGLHDIISYLNLMDVFYPLPGIAGNIVGNFIFVSLGELARFNEICLFLKSQILM